MDINFAHYSADNCLCCMLQGEKKGVSIYVVLRHQFSITYGFHPINSFFSNKLACNTVILPATLFEELLDWYFYNVGNKIPA